MTRYPFLAPDDRPAAQGAGLVPFQAHVELLQFFLTHRREAVDRIQNLLNAQRKPLEYLQNGSLLSRHFEDCLFTLPGITPAQSRLRGQLEEAHWAAGFKPREIPGLRNGLIDPAEMMIRSFHLWQQTHWPGRNGRVRYAQTLFNLYVMRSLALLSMRVADTGSNGAGDRLAQVQHVLDQLWQTTVADQPVLVRDARWLIQLAQSPATDELRSYFEVAANTAGTLPEEDRLEIHKAGVRMGGGHLRSQIRYFSTKKSVPVDDAELVRNTRNSNALDFALLVQDLVPLLEAYERRCDDGQGQQRLELAAAISQGISPDPELFLNHTDLLAAYSMIEHVFVMRDEEGRAALTPLGQRHVHLLQEYASRIGRVSRWLLEDGSHVRPRAGTYSPYGAIYGFSSDLIEHMVLKALQPDAPTRFSMEDVFSDGDADKLAWVSGWRKLPHIAPEVQAMFDYPQQFAEDMWARIERALQRRVSGGESSAAARTGRLIVLAEGHRHAGSEASQVPELPARFIHSSDRQLVEAGKVVHCDESHLLSERREGRWLISYKSPGGWVAITKAVLSEVLENGDSVTLVRLPAAVADELKLLYPGLVTVSEDRPAVPSGSVSQATTSAGEDGGDNRRGPSESRLIKSAG